MKLCIAINNADFLTLSKNLLSFTAFEVPAARYRGLVQSWEEKKANRKPLQPHPLKHSFGFHFNISRVLINV